MIRVSPSEHELLSLARAIMGLGQYAPVEDLLRGRHTVPKRLSPGALHILRDTLAKGSVLALARGGGWRKQRHLRDGQEVSGRLWERHPPPALRFSARCVDTLRWLLEEPLVKFGCGTLPEDGPPTPADELFLYLCCRLVAGTPCAGTVGAQGLFRRSALCWLGFPEVLGADGPAAISASAFAPLLADGAWLLEALQPDLASHWRALEESKRALFEPARMLQLGTIQDAVLNAFLDAIDAAGRRDLAGFLVQALRPLLEQPTARWVEGLSPSAPLSTRTAAARASGAVLRALGRLARWDAEHRAVRFFDDTYDAAQLLLSEWSPLGETGFRRAADLERELATSLTPSGAIPATLPSSPSESAP